MATDKVWVVTWSGEDGADVYLFAEQADAEAKYDELCRFSDVDPGLGYAAEGYGYTDRRKNDNDPDDWWRISARTGDKQVNISEPGVVEVL